MRSLTSTPGEVELLRILEIQRHKKYKKIFQKMTKEEKEAYYLYSLYPPWMFRVEEETPPTLGMYDGEALERADVC